MIELRRLLVQPLWDNRQEFYELIAHYNFGVEIISFAMPEVLNDPSAYEQHLKAYQQELPHLDCVKALHGAFIDIIPHSPDVQVAQVAEGRLRSSLEVASLLGCSHVVFHTGINTLIGHPRYFERVAAVQAKVWQKLLDEFQGLTICLENMWEADPGILKSVLEKTDHPRLKVCFDCGHANVFSDHSLVSWFEELGDEVVYMHWNDNHGDRDSELAVGEGRINWLELVNQVEQMKQHPLIVLEVGTIDRVKQSLDFLVANKMVSS